MSLMEWIKLKLRKNSEKQSHLKITFGFNMKLSANVSRGKSIKMEASCILLNQEISTAVMLKDMAFFYTIFTARVI